MHGDGKSVNIDAFEEVEHTHWIEEMRRAKGWTQKQLADAAGCSWGLIDMLENMHGAITHPGIADDICRVLGAGMELRDSIVAKDHQGKPWKPVGQEWVQARNGLDKAVVMLNKNWEEVGRYPSIGYAAMQTGVGAFSISLRCNKALKFMSDEFKLARGVTFRYAEEWDQMKGELQNERI